MLRNFVRYCLENDESTKFSPLLIDSSDMKGVGLANPSVLHDGDRIRVNLRNLNYTLFHSEENQFNHYYGPLQYIHPEHDVSLTTHNYMGYLDPKTLEVTEASLVDTSTHDVKPIWTFVGLEDARLIRWDGKLFLCGVRRDTTTNGVGRMELSEIEETSDGGYKEISRTRIPAPGSDNTYCEKNWMPILDKPYHWIKWCNPTEVVRFDPVSGTTETVVCHSDNIIEDVQDFRGGSQVVRLDDEHYMALIHEVRLFNSELVRKNAEYLHRVLIWDNDFNLINYSDLFHFMDAEIEFSCGMDVKGDNVLITFGYQDNAAYALSVTKNLIRDFTDRTEATDASNSSCPSMDSLDPLNRYISNEIDPYANYDLGKWYEEKGHTAPAVSFYLRAAEKTHDGRLQYTALLRAGLCFESQGDRYLTVKSVYQRVIGLDPTRPEAYYFLARIQESHEDYHDGYMTSNIGLSTLGKNDHSSLSDLNEYPGDYGLIFEKAVCAWWVGATEESRLLFFQLVNNHSLDLNHREAVFNNMKLLGYPERRIRYKGSYLSDLKSRFDGVETIRENHAQAYQDMFVLTALNGKKNGTYLEIGSHHPYYNNNTALLENQFEWYGVSVEIDKEQVRNFENERRNPVYCRDATTIDYRELLQKHFGENRVIDYLQLDCDPPEVTLEVLRLIMQTDYRFRTITFEHDFYYNSKVRDVSREILSSHGYRLLVNDVGFDRMNSFEDWWVLESETHKPSAFFGINRYDVNYINDIFINTCKC